MNHRVKNNLAAIVGMLERERYRANGPETAVYREALDRLAARVDGLSRVHGMLSASGWEPLRIDALCETIAQAVIDGRPPTEEARVELLPSALVIGSGQAQHLALVVNEVAQNFVKYCVGAAHAPRLRIDISTVGGQIRIEMSDNGPGFPEAVLAEGARSGGVGLGLVVGIVGHSLRGHVEMRNDGGAVIRIEFPPDRATTEGSEA